MTACEPLLYITDGTTKIDLLDRHSGFLLKDWTPVIPEPKEGGVFSSSPLSDGRRLVMRKNENAIETFEITVRDSTQDSTIGHMRSLRTLLTKAHQYWTSDWQTTPVYIVAKGRAETDTRYAIIKDWRIQTDGNPYAAPFAGKKPAMVDLTLLIERGNWMNEPPGDDGACVQTSAIKTAVGTVVVETYEPAATNDDAYTSDTAGTIDLTGRLRVGDPLGNAYNCGVRFDDVDVAGTVTIQYAYLRFYVPNPTTLTQNYRISGELAADAAQYSTYADFNSRTRTGYIQWTPDPGKVGYFQSPDITDIVEQIIAQGGWASGNHLAVQVRHNVSREPSEFLSVNSYDFGVYPPQLVIAYSASTQDFGQEETCEKNVFVANKENTAQLTHIYYYDAGGAAFAADNYVDNSSFDLLANMATNDYILFGSTVGPFCSLIFDLASVQSGDTIKWQYYSTAAGGSWVEFVPHDETAITNPFESSGVSAVTWKQENDWTTKDENGITAYWVRALITAGSGGTSPSQQNRYIYTVTNPHVDIEADQVGGDIPANLRILLYSRSHDDTAADATMLWSSRIYAALRSRDRGADYSPFLNASNVQHQLGVSCSAVAGSFEADTYSSSSYAAAPSKVFHVYAPGAPAASTTIVRWTIDSQYSSQYRGSYNALLRYAQNDGTDGSFIVRLAYTQGSSSGSIQEMTNPVALVLDDVKFKSTHLISLGPITLLSGTTPSEATGDIVIDLKAQSVGSGTLVSYDLILMPTDEWFAVYTAQNNDTDALKEGFVLDIDGGVVNPKEVTRALLRDTDDNWQVYSRWSIIQNGTPMLQANKAQRLYFLSDQYDASGSSAISMRGELYSVQLLGQNQYYSMIGDD